MIAIRFIVSIPLMVLGGSALSLFAIIMACIYIFNIHNANIVYPIESAIIAITSCFDTLEKWIMGK